LTEVGELLRHPVRDPHRRALVRVARVDAVLDPAGII